MPGCLFAAGSEQHRPAEGAHGSTLYPSHLYAMSIPGRGSAAGLADLIYKRQKKKMEKKKMMLFGLRCKNISLLCNRGQNVVLEFDQ